MLRTLRISLVAAALAVCALAQSPIHSLTILHTNDVHAHLKPDAEGIGGFAYLATELRRQRAGCAGCIYLNAGDLVQGSPVSTIYRGIPVYQISNLLGLDVSTLGNHEFDYGWRNIEKFVKTAHYPVVSDNVVNSQGELLTHKGYAIKTVNGVRIAVIGVILGDLVGNLSTTEQVGPWKVAPVAETVRATVAQIKGKADLIVVLGHIHTAEAEQIIHQIPEVSIVVIGHEHTGYKEVHRFENRYIVEAKAYTAELGRFDFQFDTAKHQIISADWKHIPIDSHKITPAPDVEKLVESWEAKVSKIVDVPVGESKRRLSGSELRHIVETAMAEESGADIAWINSGNVRGFLPPGQLLARNIWDLLPFDNAIMVGTFRGSDLPAPVKKEFPDLQPDRMYKLATTDFTVENQASQDQFGVSGMSFPVKSIMQRDAMIDWVKKKKILE